MAQTGVSGPVDWWSTVSRRGKLFGRAHTVALLPEEAARPMLRRTSPGPWWSTEKAFWTRSSRLQAKAEALGSIGYKSRVEVDDGSTGGIRVEAISRPRTAG